MGRIGKVLIWSRQDLALSVDVEVDDGIETEVPFERETIGAFKYYSRCPDLVRGGAEARNPH